MTLDELRAELERVEAEARTYPPMHAMRRTLNRQAHELGAQIREAMRAAPDPGGTGDKTLDAVVIDAIHKAQADEPKEPKKDTGDAAP